VDPQLPALLERTLAQLERYLEQGGIDAPTWVNDMAALERKLAELARGTADPALHRLLRDLLREMAEVYARAPGIDLQPRLVPFRPLYAALERAEHRAWQAHGRAAELQAGLQLAFQG